MDSVLKTIKYENGEIQRIQTVTLEKDEMFRFFRPEKSPEAFGRICDLYRYFAIPRAPFIFGRLMHFCLPEGIAVPDEVLELYRKSTGRYGFAAEDISRVAIAFREGLRIKKDGTVAERKKAGAGAVLKFYRSLEEKGLASVVCGRLPHTRILPVGNAFGLLSGSKKDAGLKSNSTFFIMDSFDLPSAYDVIGTPFGLTVEDGEVLTPPLYGREAFMIKQDGSVSIRIPRVKELTVCAKGMVFKDGMDGVTFLERPQMGQTPHLFGDASAVDLAVIGRKIVAVKRGGGMTIPASGFVIRIAGGSSLNRSGLLAGERLLELAGADVIYRGMEDVRFAVSAGNSVIIDGIKTTGFRAPYYNIKQFWKTKFPPSLYPLDYEKARAPRMAIGAKKDGTLLLLWAEGRGKFSYEPGTDSCGASLKELADICAGLDICNAVNLDGGGSAQILYHGARSLRVSDRSKEDNSEAERAVPLGIYVE